MTSGAEVPTFFLKRLKDLGVLSPSSVVVLFASVGCAWALSKNERHRKVKRKRSVNIKIT
jgi:hypothetical protein